MPVDLPLGQHRGVARGAPPASRRTSGSRPSSPCERGALLDRPLEPLLPDRDVEAGLAQRGRERAEGVPVERRRRHRAAPRRRCRAPSACARAPRPAGAAASTSSSRVANRRGISPAARLAAFQVPKCSITVCGCTCASGSAANSFIVGERPSRVGRAPAARRGSARPCSARRIPAWNAASASGSIFATAR